MAHFLPGDPAPLCPIRLGIPDWMLLAKEVWGDTGPSGTVGCMPQGLLLPHVGPDAQHPSYVAALR